MEKSAPPAVSLNWRFQQALYRAYYDAYIYKRLLYETRSRGAGGPLGTASRRESARRSPCRGGVHLDRAVMEPPAQDCGPASSSWGTCFSEHPNAVERLAA